MRSLASNHSRPELPGAEVRFLQSNARGSVNSSWDAYLSALVRFPAPIDWYKPSGEHRTHAALDARHDVGDICADYLGDEKRDAGGKIASLALKKSSLEA